MQTSIPTVQETFHRNLLVKTADHLLSDLYVPLLKLGRRDGFANIPVIEIDSFEVFFHEENLDRNPKDRPRKSAITVLVRDHSDKRLFDVVTYSQKFEYGAPASPLQVTSMSAENKEDFVLQVELANNILTEAVACVLSDREQETHTTH